MTLLNDRSSIFYLFIGCSVWIFSLCVEILLFRKKSRNQTVLILLCSFRGFFSSLFNAFVMVFFLLHRLLPIAKWKICTLLWLFSSSIVDVVVFYFVNSLPFSPFYFLLVVVYLDKNYCKKKLDIKIKKETFSFWAVLVIFDSFSFYISENKSRNV